MASSTTWDYPAEPLNSRVGSGVPVLPGTCVRWCPAVPRHGDNVPSAHRRYQSGCSSSAPELRDEHGSAGRRTRRGRPGPDRAPHAGRNPAAPVPRGGRHHAGPGGVRDPGLPVQDQPDGKRPGAVQGAGRHRPAHPVRRHRREDPVRPGDADPAGEHAGLVVQVRRHHGRLVRGLPGPGDGRVGHPHLRAAVRARPVPDRGLRARRHHARPHQPRPPRRSTGG